VGGDTVVESDDPARRLIVAARTERALEVRRQLMDEQAVAIARRVAELFTEA
jgi:hypothetical protein